MDDDSIADDIVNHPMEESEEEPVTKKRKRVDKGLSKQKKKKQKVQEEEEEEPRYQPVEPKDDTDERKRLWLRKCVRSMVKRNPSLNMANGQNKELEELFKIDEMLISMTTDQLEAYWCQCKEVIGHDHPGKDAESLVGLFGMGLSKRMGDPEIYQDLVKNHDLHMAIEELLPPGWYMYLSAPMQIVHAIGKAVSKSYLK